MRKVQYKMLTKTASGVAAALSAYCTVLATSIEGRRVERRATRNVRSDRRSEIMVRYWKCHP